MTTTSATEPATTWTFDIPEVNMESLRARLATLAKRAVKLGIDPLTVTEGEPKDIEVSITTPSGATKKVTRRYIPVTVTQTSPVCLDGWTFCGTIDHGADEEGNPLNILRTAPSFTGNLPKEYRTDAPTCDHCRTIRRRRETFVVQHKDGTLCRVGRQCIRDYLGHNSADHILAMERYIAQVSGACEEGMGGYFGGGEWRFSSTEVLIWTAAAIRTEGWMSRKQARDSNKEATADFTWKFVTWPFVKHSPKEAPPPELIEQDTVDATETMEWARNIDPDTDSDYLHNVRVILGRGSVGHKEVGIAASAVAVWIKERDREIARKVWLSKPSTYLGTVGQRFGGKGKGALPAIEANVVRTHSFMGNFGLTTIVALQTDEGNDLVWFCTGSLGDDIDAGKRVKVVGTVKSHELDSKTSRPTTYLNRCELTLIGDAPKAPVVKMAAAATPVPAPAIEEPEAKPEVTPAPVAAPEAPAAALAIVLTAKLLPSGDKLTLSFTSPKAALATGAELRAAGTIDWRTVRYTVNGVASSAPELRKLEA